MKIRGEQGLHRRLSVLVEAMRIPLDGRAPLEGSTRASIRPSRLARRRPDPCFRRPTWHRMRAPRRVRAVRTGPLRTRTTTFETILSRLAGRDLGHRQAPFRGLRWPETFPSLRASHAGASRRNLAARPRTITMTTTEAFTTTRPGPNLTARSLATRQCRRRSRRRGAIPTARQHCRHDCPVRHSRLWQSPSRHPVRISPRALSFTSTRRSAQGSSLRWNRGRARARVKSVQSELRQKRRRQGRPS